MSEEMQTQTTEENIESITDEAATEDTTETGTSHNENKIESITDEDSSSDPSSNPSSDTQPSDEGKQEEPKQLEEYVASIEGEHPFAEEDIKGFSNVCREVGVTKEQAEKILAWHRDQYLEVAANNKQVFEDTVHSWDKTILSDPDFGGKNYTRTVADARKALKHFDEDGSIRAMLKETRYDRHPAIIKMIARIGRAMGEDSFTGVSGSGKSEQLPLEERLFKNMNF